MQFNCTVHVFALTVAKNKSLLLCYAVILLLETINNIWYNSVIAGCVKATCLSTNKFHITAIHRVDFPTGAEVSFYYF